MLRVAFSAIQMLCSVGCLFAVFCLPHLLSKEPCLHHPQVDLLLLYAISLLHPLCPRSNQYIS
jgi:hypothetical protein